MIAYMNNPNNAFNGLICLLIAGVIAVSLLP